MAGWLSKIFAGGVGSLAESIGSVADRFIQSPDEKAQFMLEMEKLVQARDAELEETMRAELGAKERIMVAELTQGDTYTKRARPTFAYFGMVVVALNYVLFPKLAAFFPSSEARQAFMPIDMPPEFWYAWAGVVGVWSIGRTMERRGSENNLVRAITGSKQTPSLLGD